VNVVEVGFPEFSMGSFQLKPGLIQVIGISQNLLIGSLQLFRFFFFRFKDLSKVFRIFFWFINT